MRSLRTRLLIGTVGTTVAIVAATGIIVYSRMRMSLLAEFDKVLEDKARLVAFMVVIDEVGAVGVVFDRPKFPEFEEHAERAEYYEIWRANGQVMHRSLSLAKSGEPVDLEKVAGPIGAPAFRSVALLDGRPGRIVGLHFNPRRDDGDIPTPEQRQDMILVLGKDTADVDHTLAQLRYLLLGVCAAAILASAGGLGWVVAWLFYPLEHLAGRIGALRPDELSTRFSDANLPAELAAVAQRLDDLLRRLESAFAREKAFTADVAHELRTPISGLRTTLEVMLSKPRSAETYQQALRECLEICRQQQALVDNLLSLAQLESGRVPVTLSRIPLADLVRECWRSFAARSEGRRVAIEWKLDEALVVDCDREKLRMILANLFDNAVSYVDGDGRIVISCAHEAGNDVLSISNSGSVLLPEQAPLVFERFWRGDQARAATGLHCGLGLALCGKLAAILGCAIEASSSAGGTFTLTIRFPPTALALAAAH